MTKVTRNAPTMEQSSAADPTASAWVTASAGAGKTRVLTDRVLRLLLAGTPPGKILCLTFTKAAAAEMRVRITRRLGDWAVMDASALALDLQTLMMAAKHDDAVTAKARQLFAGVLDVPGGLKVQTIHSFCESLLARFPLESGLTSNFRIAEEATANEYLHAARDQVLRTTREDTGRTAALTELTSRVNEEQFTAIMKKLSGDRARLSRLLADGLGQVLQETRALLGLSETDTSQSITAVACSESKFDRKGLVAAAGALMEGSGGDANRGAAIGGWLEASAEQRADRFAGYCSAFLTQDDVPRKSLITKKASEAAPDSDGVLREEAERLSIVGQRLRAAEVAQGSAALLIVGRALHDEYERIKVRHAVLDFDDLILRAQALLTRPGIGPWVLYKLDGGIDQILIDEAQDTSPEQWDLIAAIADEFFAGQGAQDLHRTIFAVGDAKQSIYGFRQADPKAFAKWRDHFQRRVVGADQDWRPVELYQSFRSTKPVLDVVDAVFAQAPATDGLLIADREVRHYLSRTGQAGSVELWPVEPAHTGDVADAWDAPRDQQMPSSASARLADRIAGAVAGWIGTEGLPSRDRTVRAGDVLILVRRRNTFVDQVIAALKARSVPVAGTDRMVLAEQLPVMDLIALGQFVLLPQDDLNLAVVLKGPFIGLGETDLFDLAHGRKAGLWAELRGRAEGVDAFGSAYRTLSGLLGRADTVPPFQFFAEFLSGGGRHQILGRLGPESDDPVDEFLARAVEFERSHPPSLQGFLAWLAASGTDIKRDLEAGRDEVRVMTIHGAKGLQAPIVILADTCGTPTKDDPVLWADDGKTMLLRPNKDDADVRSKELKKTAAKEQTEEYHRLLYVALTRAEDQLIVCGWDTKKTRPETCWYNLVEQGFGQLDGVEELPDGVQRWSQPQTEIPDQTSAHLAGSVASSSPPAWLTQTAAPEEPDPPRPLAPSRPEGDAPSVTSPLAGGSNGLRRGILIHRMLQLLADIPDTDRDKAARHFAQAQSAEFTDAAQAEMVATTLEVLRTKEFGAVFGPGSRAEVSVAGTVGGTVIAGQIDRLVVTDHDLLIVDFKTHRPPPKAEAQVPTLYMRQMAAYRGVIRAVYPDKPVRCALLWTDGPRLMPLSDAGLDAAAP